jgi:hypothetical protein
MSSLSIDVEVSMAKLDEETMKVIKDFQKDLDVYSEGITYLLTMDRIFETEISEVAKIQAGQEDNEMAVRAVLRTLFAWVEATVFALKRIALKTTEHKELFSPAELAMLHEHSYDLDEKGKAKIQTKFIPLPKNLRFAFESCSRAFGIRNTLDVGNTGWDSFQKAIEMRNRITHPRTPEDLHISDEDFAQIELAISWFSHNVRELINQLVARLERLKKPFDDADKPAPESK